MLRLRTALALVGLLACDVSCEALGQGLILNLPKKDGAWVRYEGTVKQVELRPDAAAGDITMEWIQHLTVKSVGSETVEYRKKQVPCRWIEMKVVTGKASESGVDAGPVGERIYKVLVPEQRVVGDLVDGEKIPFSFLDIVKGIRKIGGQAAPIPTASLQVYPLVASLMHYDSIEPVGNAVEDVQVPGGAVKARKYRATRVIESPTSRTKNECELWRAAGDSVPFGLVRWSIKTTLEKKDDSQPRSAFKAVTQTTVDMSAHEWGTGAKSELANLGSGSPNGAGS